jgi:hypothetical protein
MAQGIINVSLSALEGIIDLTIDPALIDLGKLKEILLLPDRYTIDRVAKSAWRKDCVYITVSSPDIPSMKNHSEMLPIVTPFYCSENGEDHKTRIFSLLDIKVNDVSIIREEDKGRKMTVDIKEVDDSAAP